ncbi:MAG: CCA tRNA nucleotidyltransferase [Acidithiobacillus sp.]
MRLTPPSTLIPVLKSLERAGGRILVVGGAVRDTLLGLAAHDWDLEVYGLNESRLQECLAPFHAYRVGGRCAVWMAAGAEIALPQNRGQVDPHLPWRIAVQRRDFSVNALAWDWQAQCLLDAVGGIADLHSKRLRIVHSSTFGEDPLRVFRAARFAGQLGFHLDPASVQICQQLAPQLLQVPVERLRKEWQSLLLRGQDLVTAWNTLTLTGAIACFPSLQGLQAVPQRPDAHPEGDVWMHTGQVLAAAASLRSGEASRDIVLMLGALLHDVGKVDCTRRDPQGRWRALGHEQTFGRARSFLNVYFPDNALRRQILPLLRWHGAPHALYRDQAGHQSYAKLALRLPDRRLLLDLALADARGAGQRNPPAIAHTQDTWEAMGLWNVMPKPLIRGEDLIALGIQPGPNLGRILAQAYEKQVIGNYREAAALLRALRPQLIALSRPNDRAC